MSDIMEGSLRVVKQDGMNPIRYLWQTVCDRVREVCQTSTHTCEAIV